MIVKTQISLLTLTCMVSLTLPAWSTDRNLADSFRSSEPDRLCLFQNTEEKENIDLQVKGEIPEWLNGEFVRNGPGLMQGEKGSIKSWFDGLAKLHAFTIKDGKVTYTCKFLESDHYKNYKETGEFNFFGFAQQPQSNSSFNMDDLPELKDTEIQNANVNVFKINNQRVALTGAPLPVKFGEDLKTLGSFNYEDNLPKKLCIESAHMLQDPDTKAIWNFLIKMDDNIEYQIYKIPPLSNERKLVASIPVESLSYMHSFSLAGKYFVLIDYPLRAYDPEKLGQGFLQAFSWFGEENTKVYVIDKDSGKYKTLLTDPFFSFHHINGYEGKDKIYLDLIAYPIPGFIFQNNIDPTEPLKGQLWQLEMDLLTQTIKKTHTQTYDHFEFPRLNESFIGKRNDYFYAVHNDNPGMGLIKYDWYQSEYWYPEGSYATEPVFVPRPGSELEDDGVILSVVNDLKKKKSFLLILNGQRFNEVARVEAPHLIPFGFHGQFF